MIQVTLNFPTAAEAAAVLARIAGPAERPVDPPAPSASPAARSPASASAAPAAKPSSAPTPAAASPTPSPAPAADDGPLPYEVLQKAVFALAAKSKDAAMAVNAEFGVKTMKDLPEGRRREALAAVQAKLTELEVA